jgi:hypothetical protein
MQMHRTESEDDPLYYIKYHGRDLTAKEMKEVKEIAETFYKDENSGQLDLFQFLHKEGFAIIEVEPPKPDFEIEW